MFSVFELLVYRGIDSLSKEEFDQKLVEDVIDESVDEQKKGTRSLTVDCGYSNLLDLLRVKTRLSSYNLYATPCFSFPSHLTLVKLIKLKKKPKCVYREREKEREREKKNREKTMFFFIVCEKRRTPAKIKNKIK